MGADLAHTATVAQYVSAAAMGAVVLLRAPAAARSPAQRGLWLAVATAAVAMALQLPVVIRAALDLTGSVHEVGLARNLFGVLSAGCVLYFVTAAAQHRWWRWGLVTSVALVVLALVLLDQVREQHDNPGGPSSLSAYWAILMGSHIVANTVCVHVCLWQGCRASAPSLRLSLWIFGAGTALVGIYWCVALGRLIIGEPPLRNLSLLMSLHGFLRAAALLVPLWGSMRSQPSQIRTLWVLWPLWRTLVQAVPHVALHRRRSRIVEVVWPRAPRRLAVYRRMIEIRDAILSLHGYVHPALPGAVKSRVEQLGLHGRSADAMTLACLLHVALRARRTGAAKDFDASLSHGWDSVNISGEESFLLELARAFRTPVARSLAGQLGGRTGGLTEVGDG
ncbi:MAB_1171c family putative transporter [Streptomyces kanamyceticus]|uniref:MAB_1171c family putative transporter n=1 Tax=Streptomyces kanamyceticus TaxID=1967 RepID=UPI000AA9E463|nr:MAB_1171c family putative transporter [Streptomyces kanamyceticus]